MDSDPNQPLIDAFEGVPFTINDRPLVGRCLLLKDAMRFARLYQKAMDEKTPPDEANDLVEQLMADFPTAIGHPDLRMTLTEFWLTLRRFLYLRRGAPAPAEAGTMPETPAAPVTAPAASPSSAPQP